MKILVAGRGSIADPLSRLPASSTLGGDPLSPDYPDRAAAAVRTVDTLVILPDCGNVAAAARGTFTLMCAAAQAGVRRVVLVSTLALFRRIPRAWKLDESWRPRPSPELWELCHYVAEVSAREIVHQTRLVTLCLRLGDSLSSEEAVDAVVAAIGDDINYDDSPAVLSWNTSPMAGLRQAVPSADMAAWRIKHVGDVLARPRDDRRRPWRDMLTSRRAPSARPIKTIAILGAGGPVSAAAVEALKEAPSPFVLRLADIRKLTDIHASGKPQSAGFPLPKPAQAPDEERVANVVDLLQVQSACDGADAIINFTASRYDMMQDFLVNVQGVYNVCVTAASQNIRRVVLTGPQQFSMDPKAGYVGDWEIAGDAPARPGLSLYAHTKFVGFELARAMAEWHRLEVVVLLFNSFVNPDVPGRSEYFAVSFGDAARAVRLAIDTPSLPSPYEVMTICADLPHGYVTPRRARDVIGWTPQDSLDIRWRK